MTTLHNETITEPRYFKGEKFTGTTVLDYDGALGESGFEDCGFNAQGARYAILVPRDRKPRASIRGDRKNMSSIIRGAWGASGKLVLGQWLGFFGVTMFDAPDGVFGQAGGAYMHIEDSEISVFAPEGAHGDCVQLAGGSYLTVKGCYLSARGPGGNSCVFLESLAPPVGVGPCKRVRLVGNVFDGGGYGVYSIEDPNAPGGPNEDIVMGRNQFKNQVFGEIAWTAGSRPTILERA